MNTPKLPTAEPLAPLTGSALTLTVREIFDLGKAAQVIPWKATLADSQLSDEDAETEYTVFTRKGGVQVNDDDGTPRIYKHGAYLDEYPEEGTFPLGEARNDGTVAQPPTATPRKEKDV